MRSLMSILVLCLVVFNGVVSQPILSPTETSEQAQVASHVWSALGTGANNEVWALVTSGSDVYAGGMFTAVGGTASGTIARWNGSAWSTPGTGIASFYVEALAAADGMVYAAGVFSNAGGVSVSNIARWDGSAWSALGTGVNNEVMALAASGTTAYAGGFFTMAGGVAVNKIAKWNGSTWSALGSGLNNYVTCIAINGSDVYVGGEFTTAGGSSANRIAKWNGSAWSALGTGLNGTVYAVAVNGGVVYVGGNFTTAGGSTANRIAMWNGSAWSAIGSGVNGTVRSIVSVNGDLYVGGEFTTATQSDGVTTVSTAKIAKWNGVSWSGIGSGAAGTVRALCVNGTAGVVVAGGAFVTVDGSISSNRVASFSDSENALPVTMDGLSVSAHESEGVVVRWSTRSEVDNVGWEVERRSISRQSTVVSNQTEANAWKKIGFVEGAGTSSSPREYHWIDDLRLTIDDSRFTQLGSRISYRLRQIDRSGSFSYSHEAEVEVGLAPKEFTLGQNYPNPFNPSTTITFTVAEDARTSLSVYDLLGREVARLVDEDLKAGILHQAVFDARTLPSGMYLVRLRSGTQTALKKILLAK